MSTPESGVYQQASLSFDQGAPILYGPSEGETGISRAQLFIMPEMAYAAPAVVELEPELSDYETGLEPVGEEERRISVGDLYAAGEDHDARIYGGLEDEDSFPTRMYYLSWRNDELFRAAREVRQFMLDHGVTDAADIPEDMKNRLVQHYVDFEIACKTAVSELGFDPVELRQRTLAYRAKKYDTQRMAVIREEIRSELEASPSIPPLSDTSEEGIDAEVKRRVKRENAGTSRMDSDIHYTGFDTSYEEQQRVTAEWEDAFTHGRGQDLHGGLDQLMSELNESQQEVLRFFEAYIPGAHVQGTLTESALYEMAAEIDDVGVAGLSMLNKFGIENVSAIFDERLALQDLRFSREIVHAYYEYYGDMRYALEATRRTGSFVDSNGNRNYQMNFFIHPALRGSIRDADVVAAKMRKYSPAGLTAEAVMSGDDVDAPKVVASDKEAPVPDYPIFGGNGSGHGRSNNSGGYLPVEMWRAQ